MSFVMRGPTMTKCFSPTSWWVVVVADREVVARRRLAEQQAAAEAIDSLRANHA